jgi:hypothetical protein
MFLWYYCILRDPYSKQASVILKHLLLIEHHYLNMFQDCFGVQLMTILVIQEFDLLHYNRVVINQHKEVSIYRKAALF